MLKVSIRCVGVQPLGNPTAVVQRQPGIDDQVATLKQSDRTQARVSCQPAEKHPRVLRNAAVTVHCWTKVNQDFHRLVKPGAGWGHDLGLVELKGLIQGIEFKQTTQMQHGCPFAVSPNDVGVMRNKDEAAILALLK